MIKQFRYYTTCSFKYTVITYHDGIEQSSESVWSTELDDYIDRLYAEGYIYGYTKAEVESAYKRYRKIKILAMDVSIGMMEIAQTHWIQIYMKQKRNDF